MKVKNGRILTLKLTLGISKEFFLRTSEWMEKLYVRQKYFSIHQSIRQQFYNPKHISRNHCKQIGYFNHSSNSFKFSYLWRHKAQVDLTSVNVWFSTSTCPQLNNDEYVWTWNGFGSIDNFNNSRVVCESSFCFLSILCKLNV